MTWNSKPMKIPKSPPGKPITPEQLASSGSEDGNQMALFAWAALNTETYPQLKNLFAIPNGGNRHIVEAIKFVGTGTRSGVPDTMLAEAIQKRDYQGFGEAFSYGYHGLFIEMKKEMYRNRKNGGRSDEQIEWSNRLTAAGYYVKTCYNWIEARDTLIAYLEGKL